MRTLNDATAQITFLAMVADLERVWELRSRESEQGWELVTYAQPFTGYHGGCYTFKRQK